MCHVSAEIVIILHECIVLLRLTSLRVYIAASEVNDMVAIAVWRTEELHSASIQLTIG